MSTFSLCCPIVDWSLAFNNCSPDSLCTVAAVLTGATINRYKQRKMLGNTFLLHVAKDVCIVSGASTTTSSHICFQISIYWFKVCGEGHPQFINFNILWRCTLLISWMFLGINYIPHAAWTCICENLKSNSQSKWSIVGMRTATLKYSFVIAAGRYVASFVILWQIIVEISSVSAIVAICVALFQKLSSKNWSQSFFILGSCVWTNLILLYTFMMYAYNACNITLNGFVSPRVYNHTFRATINVGSDMLFIRPVGRVNYFTVPSLISCNFFVDLSGVAHIVQLFLPAPDASQPIFLHKTP